MGESSVMTHGPLRICLLTYRGNPRSGGQGIYVRLLSKELTALGHHVDVWSGQPYPELLPGVGMVPVPSLDLWNEKALFRTPSLGELLDPINLREWAKTRIGGFPEPLTFSQRVARRFANSQAINYDVVHDNQCLGPGLLAIQRRVPVVATIHHPITVDRRIAYQSARTAKDRFGLRQFYSFLPTQLHVSRQLERVLTVSEASKTDLHREYGVSLDRMRVVGNGINLEVFAPMPEVARKRDQLITTLSADAPLKGFRFLLDALYRLRRTRKSLHLVVIGKLGEKTDTRERVRNLGLSEAITFTGHVAVEDIARHYAESAIAIVPSLYEGFGFPAGEAMACEVPVVSTRAGALPEVVGRDGETGVLVDPGSGEALAIAIAELLDHPERAAAIGRAGRQRVLREFTWRRAAERTVDAYRDAMEIRHRQVGGIAC